MLLHATFLLALVAPVHGLSIQRNRVVRRNSLLSSTLNPIEKFFSAFSPAVAPAGSEYDEDIAAAKALLVRAAKTKEEESGAVVDALLNLEKLMRAKAREDESVATETVKNLDGAWRLVFTTGTIDTQKKIKGQINYFPLKAVQTFDTSGMKITNSIMVGDISLIKFFGPFDFNLKTRKLEFDFTAIAVLGAKFDLPKGGAAEIGSATGLGSDNNKQLVDAGKKPFFNWISADADIATARGGGGGLALWMRTGMDGGDVAASGGSASAEEGKPAGFACAPGAQNCVAGVWVAPAGTSAGAAAAALRGVLEAYPQEGQAGVDGGGWVVAENEGLKLSSAAPSARFEFSSAGTGPFAKLLNGGKPFVDDLELRLLTTPGKGGKVEVAFRSSSRIGKSDLGVNAKRVAYIAQGLRALGWEAPEP